MCYPYKTGLLVLYNLGVSAVLYCLENKVKLFMLVSLYVGSSYPPHVIYSCLPPYQRVNLEILTVYTEHFHTLILTTPEYFLVITPFYEKEKTQEVMYSRLKTIKALQSKSQTTKFISSLVLYTATVKHLQPSQLIYSVISQNA